VLKSVLEHSNVGVAAERPQSAVALHFPIDEHALEDIAVLKLEAPFAVEISSDQRQELALRLDRLRSLGLAHLKVVFNRFLFGISSNHLHRVDIRRVKPNVHRVDLRVKVGRLVPVHRQDHCLLFLRAQTHFRQGLCLELFLQVCRLLLYHISTY